MPIPPNQGAAAQAFQDLVKNFFLPGATSNLSDIGNPPASYFPEARSLFATNFLNPDYNLPARSGASDAASLYQSLYPYISNALPGLSDVTNISFGPADALVSNAFDPRYGQLIRNIENNPYFDKALSGAQDASSLYARLFPQSVEQLAALRQGGTAALAGVPTALDQGFDPRQALFNRSQQQALDYANVANSMAGVGASPYGASVTANALNNFNIDWQNQQLARQAQAAQTARSLLGAGEGAELVGQNLASNVAGNVAKFAGLPSSVYQAQQNAVANALNQRNRAGIQGIAGLANILNAGSGSLQTQANLANQLSQNLASTAGLPYDVAAKLGGNALSGINNVSNLGLSAYDLPQTVLNELASYQRLGQIAAGTQGQLSNLGFNQLSQGIGGGLSGLNTLFNPNTGLFSGGGGGGLAGLPAGADLGGGGDLLPVGQGSDFIQTVGGGSNFLSNIPIIGPLVTAASSIFGKP